MKIIITAELDGLWATHEQFAMMSDEEIVEMAREDLYQLVDGATWLVVRDTEELVAQDALEEWS